MEHVVYNTVGTTFEQYLDIPELYNMGLVSGTARSGPLAVKFRQMAAFLLGLGDKLISIPLRTHAKISDYDIFKLYEIAEFLWESKDLRTEAITVLRIEMVKDELVKKTITDARNISFFINTKHGSKEEHISTIQTLGYDLGIYDLAIKYPNIDEFFTYQASIRFNSSIFEFIIQTNFPRKSIWNAMYYYLDPEIRALVIKYNPSIVEEAFTFSFLSVSSAPKDNDGFALCMPEQLPFIVKLAKEFLDFDLLELYIKQYFKGSYDKDIIYSNPNELYYKLGTYK